MIPMFSSVVCMFVGVLGCLFVGCLFVFAVFACLFLLFLFVCLLRCLFLNNPGIPCTLIIFFAIIMILLH